jgi:hypothetical protein
LHLHVFAALADNALPRHSWFDDPPADGRPVDEVMDELAAADFEHLAAVVSAAQEDAAVHAIVILTHTVPRCELLRKGVYPRGAVDAAFYGNSRMEGVPALDTSCKIALWHFGHSHAGADAQLGHIRYLSHPRGRPDDFNRVVYAPLLVDLVAAAGVLPTVSLVPTAAAPAEADAPLGPSHHTQ